VGRVGWGRRAVWLARGLESLFARRRAPPPTNLPHEGGGESFSDNREHAFQALAHIVVPDAKDAVAFGVEERGAGLVIGLALVVLAAIDFDDQLGRVRAEIDLVAGAERHLFAPVRVRVAFTERAPEAAFLGCHVAAELAGAGDGVGSEAQAPQALPPCGGGLGGGRRAVWLAR
jgi:hypothetical protein